MSDYHFSDFKDFFEYNLKRASHNSAGTKILTLNELSRKLGYRSPSLLSMISKGKRLPSNEILEVLFNEWNTDLLEREVIRLRVEIERRKRKNRPIASLIERLEELSRKSNYQLIDLNVFNSIKDWHNLVLKTLVSTPDFSEDYEKISQQLRKKVTAAEVKKGIETLLHVGLIVRDESSGRLVPKTSSGHETTHDIPSEAIREHHKGMIGRALESIDEQGVEERHINSLTLKFNKQRRDEAKSTILKFVKDFNDKFFDDEGLDVYQLNVQFFGHTQNSQSERV